MLNAQFVCGMLSWLLKIGRQLQFILQTVIIVRHTKLAL